MRTSSHQLASPLELQPELAEPNSNADLILVYGSLSLLEEPLLLTNLHGAYPNALLAGCSGAGELINGEVFDNSIVYSVFEFEQTTVRQARKKITAGTDDEFDSGKALLSELLDDDLVAIMIYSEGISIDCDELIKGAREIIGDDIPLFGGLAADSNAFEYSVVLDSDGVYDDSVVAIGFYGKQFNVNSVSSIFNQNGIEIDITASDGNIVYEINGEPASEVYEKFIPNRGDLSLSTWLFYPVLVLDNESKQPLYCRTIHDYKTENKYLLAAGSIPEGPAKVISLVDSKDIIVDANKVSKKLKNQPGEFAFVISCAGRRAIMGDEWMNESSRIQKNIGDIPSMGFYSFGEISINNMKSHTVLHNHSLTIVTISEK